MFQLLENYGLYMSDAHFKELCSRLSFHSSHMTYTDFVKNFEDQRHGGPASELQKSNNHRVNKIRGDRTDMKASELETRLRTKLRENFDVSCSVRNTIHNMKNENLLNK